MTSLEKLKKFRQKIDELSGPIEENLSKICELDKECMEKQRFVSLNSRILQKLSYLGNP
jgi:hypothetical protein